MRPYDKPLVWLHQEIKSPPFSKDARLEAGFLLRKLQKGDNLSLPQSRPMPIIGKRCHEIRINDEKNTWRIIYRIDADAIILLEIFNKKTQQTPKKIIETCKKRIKDYDSIYGKGGINE
jgi:phage-related protein